MYEKEVVVQGSVTYMVTFDNDEIIEITEAAGREEAEEILLNPEGDVGYPDQ